jgi:hypothetical protein
MDGGVHGYLCIVRSYEGVMSCSDDIGLIAITTYAGLHGSEWLSYESLLHKAIFLRIRPSSKQWVELSQIIDRS